MGGKLRFHPTLSVARTLLVAGRLGIRRGTAAQVFVPRLVVQRLVVPRFAR
jgi:hypothetical protein